MNDPVNDLAIEAGAVYRNEKSEIVIDRVFVNKVHWNQRDMSEDGAPYGHPVVDYSTTTWALMQIFMDGKYVRGDRSIDQMAREAANRLFPHGIPARSRTTPSP